MTLKKMGPLCVAVLTIGVFLAPANASANNTEWTKVGETLTTGDKIHFEGTTGYASETLGGFHCASKFTMELQLSAGTHNGQVVSFADSSPTTDCYVSGFLGSVCGTNSLMETELLKNAPVTGTTSGQLHVSEIEQKYVFGECLTLVLSGGFVMALDSTTAATTVNFTSELDTGGFGQMQLRGDLGITAGQSGVYGIGTF